MQGVFFVDGHTHLYRMYDRDAFFDGALANMTAATAQLPPGQPSWGCLLFSETARDHAFAELGREATESCGEAVVDAPDCRGQLAGRAPGG